MLCPPKVASGQGAASPRTRDPPHQREKLLSGAWRGERIGLGIVSPAPMQGRFHFLDDLGQITQPLWFSYMRDGDHATGDPVLGSQEETGCSERHLVKGRGTMSNSKKQNQEILVSQKEPWSGSEETCFAVISWVARFPICTGRG